MFHDSNSADPSGSIPKPPTDGNTNGPGTGQTTDPPPVTPITVTNFYVSGTAAMGYEGQKPPLTGLTVEVWWSNGKYDTFTGNAIAANGFVTVPAVLSAAYTNVISGNVTNVTQAAWTPITIYHAPTGIAVNQPFVLPGVRAIDTSYNATGRTVEGVTGVNYVSGTALISGSVAAFYEDDVAPDLSGVRVSAVYQPIVGNGFDITTTGSAAAVQFNLDARNYIFTDYWKGFPMQQKSGAPRYEFGIDTTDRSSGGDATVYALISRAQNTSLHEKAGSESKYVKVPLDKLYNINHIIMGDDDYTLVAAGGLENDGLGYWFSDDTRFLGNNASLSTAGAVTNGTDRGLNDNINGSSDGKTPNPGLLSGRAYWEGVIKASEVEFKVHYMGVADAETKDRDQDFLKRAFEFGNAQVASVPNFRLYEDDPNAVTLRLGYFGWDLLKGGNVPSTAQWLNYLNFTIPIARFLEEIRFERPKLTVDPLPIDQRPAAGTTISNELLASIKDTYILQGVYEYNGPGNEDGRVYREVPQDLWRNAWFNTGDLRGYSEDVASEIELEVTIRRDNALLGAGFAAYVGLESTVPIWAMP